MDQIIANTKVIPAKIIKKIDDLNKRAWLVHDTQATLGLELSSEAKNLSEEYSYQKGLAYSIRNMGVSNRYLSNLELALSLSMQAMDMFLELDDKSGESQSLVSIAAIYYYMGDYDKGLDYFLHGLKHGEEVGNKESTAYAYNGAGYIYALLGNLKKGLEFLQNALPLSRKLQNFSLESSVLESIAYVYLHDEQFDKAYETYIECQHLSEQKNDKRNLGYALFGIGEILMNQKKLTEAKPYFLKSLLMHREIGYKVGEANSLLLLGRLSFLQKETEQTKEYLLESLKVAEEIKAKAAIYMAHEALAELYERKEEFQLFVKHYKLFQKIKSEVFKDEQETKQKYLNIQYEMEKLQKEAEINRLTNVVMKEKNTELEKKTEELEKSYNSVSVLSKIGRDITSTLDLETILNTVYENVNQLMDATVFGIGIYKSEEAAIEYRLSVEEGKRYQPYIRMMSDKSQLAVWCIENEKEVFINDIEKEFSRYLKDIDITFLKSAALEDGSMPKSPKSLIYLPLQVKDKTIGLISVQTFENNAYTQYHLDILKTLASYTSAALYNASSFETLQGTLSELKLTQEQLIQSEKMASLGELTAGIAHEIQNPLNFVNNFAEVSADLVTEMNEEMDAGNTEDVKVISNDLKQNLEKISHHGKRASNIVKGMLEHSRASDGKRELTDINTLADEYLRLAYHGLRAKDKSFNADFKTDFDKTLPKINIIQQDIGRVLLNLINNAFHACAERSRTANDNKDFKPLVSLFTLIEEDTVVIKVKDNGNGIPESIKDKIFQPFFTTKPTGQGTGLGLSLSHDIIKAHGGTISIESKENSGTEFIIFLPIKI
jgi:signal transduction histidine kinase